MMLWQWEFRKNNQRQLPKVRVQSLLENLGSLITLNSATKSYLLRLIYFPGSPISSPARSLFFSVSFSNLSQAQARDSWQTSIFSLTLHRCQFSWLHSDLIQNSYTFDHHLVKQYVPSLKWKWRLIQVFRKTLEDTRRGSHEW